MVPEAMDMQTMRASNRCLVVLCAHLLLSTVVLADNSDSNDTSANEDERQVPPWLQPGGDDASYDEASDLDYDRDTDMQFLPLIGGAWFGDGDGGAFTFGLGSSFWQRWTSVRSKADIGASTMLVYQGYDGATRGRSLRLGQRIVMGGGLFHLRLGGDIATSRHRYDFRPHLNGILAGGPAGELSLLKEGSGVVGGLALDWFLGQGRLSQSADSPLAEICDEFRAHAGIAVDGNELRYQLLWNAEGPTHAVVMTHPY